MGKKHPEGFTLIELLVLMMVLALTLGIGVPALNTMFANNKMTGAANDLVSSLMAARGQASTRSRTVTLCASSDWDADAPSCAADASLLDGWIAFEDVDADGVADDGERVFLAHGPLDERIRLAAGTATDGALPAYVAFRPDGFPQDLGGTPGIRNIQLCDQRGNVEVGGGRAAGRWIAITPAGRASMTDRVDRLQSAANPLGGCPG